MADTTVRIPDEHYVGVIVNRERDELPLAFMTPNGTDSAAKKRKESVDSWVSQNNRRGGENLDPLVYKNTPMSGFRLGSTIRRLSRYGGNVKWRIEDPRGFELEISSENFEDIYTECVIDRGDILAECIWARSGSENILLPTHTATYQAAIGATALAGKKIDLKSLKIGDYVTLQNGYKGRYLGRPYLVVFSYNPDGTIYKALEYVQRHILMNDSEIYAVATPKFAEAQEGEPLTEAEVEALIAADINNGKSIISAGNSYSTYYVKAISFTKNVVITREAHRNPYTGGHVSGAFAYEVGGNRFISMGHQSFSNDIIVDALDDVSWEQAILRPKNVRNENFDLWEWRRNPVRYASVYPTLRVVQRDSLAQAGAIQLQVGYRVKTATGAELTIKA